MKLTKTNNFKPFRHTFNDTFQNNSLKKTLPAYKNCFIKIPTFRETANFKLVFKKV